MSQIDLGCKYHNLYQIWIDKCLYWTTRRKDYTSILEWSKLTLKWLKIHVTNCWAWELLSRVSRQDANSTAMGVQCYHHNSSIFLTKRKFVEKLVLYRKIYILVLTLNFTIGIKLLNHVLCWTVMVFNSHW